MNVHYPWCPCIVTFSRHNFAEDVFTLFARPLWYMIFAFPSVIASSETQGEIVMWWGEKHYGKKIQHFDHRLQSELTIWTKLNRGGCQNPDICRGLGKNDAKITVPSNDFAMRKPLKKKHSAEFSVWTYSLSLSLFLEGKLMRSFVVSHTEASGKCQYFIHLFVH